MPSWDVVIAHWVDVKRVWGSRVWEPLGEGADTALWLAVDDQQTPRLNLC